MSIFKREQEPPYNRAAARSSPPVAPAPQSREPAPAPPPASPGATLPGPAPVAAVAPPVAREAAAVVDRKTEITGTLHSSGNVLIEGRFHGEVEANETVWVEKGAQSDGQLRASAAVISGAVDGQIDCGARLQIAASAVVSGEIKTPILVIEDGATVNCRFSMTRAGSAYGGTR
jgi:cytoskeletal protein CcmA (bactofilin family)